MTEERDDEGLIESQDAGNEAPPTVPPFDELGADAGPEDVDPGDFGEGEGEIDASALLAEAEEDQMRARASWHLLPRAMFVFAFANCLFFAGALAAWSRDVPADWQRAWNEHVAEEYSTNEAARIANTITVEDLDPSTYLTGLDTIRGTLIFAFAIYGFLQLIFSIHGRTIRIWPYMINALLALEVGITGITTCRDGRAWEMAGAYLDHAEQKTMFDDMFLRWSAIPPAYWALTAGGVLVLIVSLASIMQGAQKAKAAAAEEAEGRRRRR